MKVRNARHGLGSAAARVLSGVVAKLRSARRSGATGPTRNAVPSNGDFEHRHEIPLVDPLSDGELAELNGLLPWQAFTVDRHGRRFGGVAWAGKRDRPQSIPDRRIARMNERFGLEGRQVLEVGCFEGIHTVGLARFGAEVTAVDGRIENVVKTIVRAACYGCHPRVFRYDVERIPVDIDLLRADLLHHVGVLYHLQDPVRNLLAIGSYIGSGVMLDTHYAADHEAESTYEVEGTVFRYKLYRELGRQDAFSGLYPHSKWLPLGTIVGLLQQSGFAQVQIAETRNERNGPRVLLFAERA